MITISYHNNFIYSQKLFSKVLCARLSQVVYSIDLANDRCARLLVKVFSNVLKRVVSKVEVRTVLACARTYVLTSTAGW